jgi:hypothetical protein
MTDKTLFSTTEAAKYLGLKIPAMKYHIFVAKNLTGQKLGNSLVFTKDQLDQFKLVRRPQGRPKKEKQNNDC